MLAAGSVLLTGPAAALELGEIQIQSALGQPLRASIAYALAPNEQLADYCLYVRTGQPGGAGGLPVVNDATARLADGRILLRGNTSLREPLMNLQLTVDCAETPHIRRDYLLMLDPAPIAARRQSASAGAVAATNNLSPVRSSRGTVRENVHTVESRRSARAVPGTATPIATGSAYKVQRGDTLSDIASRIPNRDVRLWPAVDALFVANPQAFIDGDRDRIKAGATLLIPDTLRKPAAASAAAVTVAEAAPGTGPGTIGPVGSRESVAAPPAADAETAAREPAAVAPSANEAINPFAEPAPLENGIAAAASAATENESRSPVVAIPETRIEAAAAPVPVVGNRVGSDKVGSGNSLSWLMGLGGTGVAIILGLLLFGRSVRERIGDAVRLPNLKRLHEHHDTSDETDETDETDATVGKLRDTLSNATAFTLDADLENGSGFDSDPGMDIAQDFNFASSGEYSQDLDLDIEFDQRSAQAPEQEPTDTVPASVHEEFIIVDSEVPPGADSAVDTGYDLPRAADTARQYVDEIDDGDLPTIEVNPMNFASEDSGSYTLTEEAGYRLIEQDYEDEFTATQVLNHEIEEAARELTRRIDADSQTTVAPLADDNEALTVEIATMHADPDDSAADSMAQDLDNTAEMTSTLATDGPAVNDDLLDSDLTAEMPADQHEITLEVELDDSRMSQRKSRAS